MRLLNYSSKELMDVNKYAGVQDIHIMISIKSPETITVIPKIPQCKDTLYLEFLDKDSVSADGFNKKIAKDILDFVNLHCKNITTIVSESNEGVSRSVAILSALSKILNNKDDMIFNQGLPNILIYTTLLDVFFTENYKVRWRNITDLRERSLKENLLKDSLYKEAFYRLHN